jgi:hypothetical protein
MPQMKASGEASGPTRCGFSSSPYQGSRKSAIRSRTDAAAPRITRLWFNTEKSTGLEPIPGA